MPNDTSLQPVENKASGDAPNADLLAQIKDCSEDKTDAESDEGATGETRAEEPKGQAKETDSKADRTDAAKGVLERNLPTILTFAGVLLRT